MDKNRGRKITVTWVHLKWWGILEEKKYSRNKGDLLMLKVQRSLKFVFDIFSLSSRSKVLVFV